MSRFPKADLEVLKATADLAAVVGAVVELEKQGQDLVGRCPFHDDDSPSFKVTPSKNLWHCFGCGAGGDVIAFVMKQQQVSFRHAVELLKSQAPLVVAPTKTAPRLSSPVTLGASHHAALAQVADFYHSTLNDSPEALSYLEKRGVTAEAVAHFRLGYANRTLGLRLPAKNRVDGEQLRGALAELGVFRESGHEHLAGSVVVPLLDGAGDVVGMYGRKILSNLRLGTPKHLYLPGPHRGVFNGAALAMSSEVILCESLIDALTFWCAGIRNVTTSYGVEGFTDELLVALKAAQVKSVLIAYDRDDAGDTAAAALSTRLQAEGLAVGRVLFPKGMDANDYALKLRPASKSLGLVLERAREAMLVAPRAQAVVVEQMPKSPAPKKEATSPTPHPLAAVAPQPAVISEATTMTPMTSSPTFDELVIMLETRRYRVRGLMTNTIPTVLKVNLMVHCGRSSFVDTVDMFQAKQRNAFVLQAARELGVNDDAIKRDLSDLLLRLEVAHQEMLAALLAPKKREPPPMSAEEEAAALALLKRPDFIAELMRDFERCGVVGEEDNKLLGYLAMTSRKTSTPLAVVVESLSAAGKSSLMDAVLAFCPDEDKTKLSAMTQQSLFYMGQAELKHQVLAIAEEEGAKNASLPLKLMQSDGEVTIAAPGKDPQTGRLTTTTYKVEGPVMLFITTTSTKVEDELLNRCLVLSVNENREQTRAIHKLQRERRTLEGRVLARQRADVMKLHQNAQRLLRNVEVVNPFAKQLTFVDDKTRTRRDHMKYLLLIEAIALIHQHQRAVRSAEQVGVTFEYIEVTVEDIRLANRLAHITLGQSLDELPPHTRKLLGRLDAHVKKLCAERQVKRDEVRLTRRELLDVTGLSYTQLTEHLDRLVNLEHVLAHTGSRGRTFVYELIFDGDDQSDGPHLSGLIDVESLEVVDSVGTISTSRGVHGVIPGPSRAILVGPPEKLVVDEKPPESEASSGSSPKREGVPKNGSSNRHASYRLDPGAL